MLSARPLFVRARLSDATVLRSRDDLHGERLSRLPIEAPLDFSEAA